MNLFCLWFIAMFGFYDPFTIYFDTAYSPKLTLVLALGAASFLAGLLVLPRVTLAGMQQGLGTPSARQIRVARVVAISFSCYSVLVAIVNLSQSHSHNISDLYTFSGSEEVTLTPLQVVLYKLMYRPMLYSYLVAIGFLFASSVRDRLLYIIGPLTIYVLSNLTQYGGRGVVLLLPAVCIILWCHLSPKREIFRLSVFGTAALAAFFILQLVRHGQLAEGGVSANDLVESVGTGGEWEPIICLSELIQSRNKLDVETAIIRFLDEAHFWVVNWVPRGLWPDKPDTDFASRMSFDLYGNMYAKQDWVRNFTYIGQGYFIWGEYGVVLISFLFGAAVAGSLYVTSRKPGLGGVYCFLLYESIYLSRDSFTTWLFDACVILMYSMLIDRYLFNDKSTGKWQRKQTPSRNGAAMALPAYDGSRETDANRRMKP
jgi:hypothetical protein